MEFVTSTIFITETGVTFWDSEDREGRDSTIAFVIHNGVPGTVEGAASRIAQTYGRALGTHHYTTLI